ncbi:plakophilin-1-like [Dunckerocampus dactyliophorus]|uniref:plakophilin-1-like n=1 Tax=Dunckerocampus dactyliophorus TaxID=161453 RepID=UPI00240734BC|nr:plakophilin-1-like [Dunckerocampus dactyliophorus]XP_054641489.1 plakophilin-1-like [Dunckerocampus dactyliophorus]
MKKTGKVRLKGAVELHSASIRARSVQGAPSPALSASSPDELDPRPEITGTRRTGERAMAHLEPLKSALSIVNVDDTSLALPSAHQYRSGQQRVLEQVQSVQRTRSRHSSSRTGSTSLSPTSPLTDVFNESCTSNGNAFFGNGYSKTHSQEKNVNRQVINSTASVRAKKKSSFTHRYNYGYSHVGPVTLGPVAANHDEPDLGWKQHSLPKQHNPPQRLQVLSNRSTYRAERTVSQQFTNNNQQFVHKQAETNKTQSKPPVMESITKSKGDSGSGNSGIADLTMKEAVEFLSNEDDRYKHCGAAYIQHNTFIDDKAKEEVLKLNGIAPLVALLQSPGLRLNQAASAALRNLSFKNNNNKEEIQRCGGIVAAVALLRETDSLEIQKQLTGLLWNLSSTNSLKTDLLKTTLPVLMDRIILPYTTSPERATINGPDHETFFHATSCLRNLSSTKQSNRQTMRKCRGLVDSLVAYLEDCVDAGKPEDKSVENCVCILHNLTFQLQTEAPALFNRITALAMPVSKGDSEGDSGPIGCFSPQRQGSESKRYFDFPVVEDPHPSGVGWLIHSKTLQTYLSLLRSSQQEETQEACSGALQNLTAHEGIVSNAMSQTIVQKLDGLQAVTPLLKSNKVSVQRNAVALVRNLSKNANLHSTLARKVLPELLSILQAGTSKGNESDDTLALACQAANFLLTMEPERGKHLLNGSLINSLQELSQNRYFPKTSKAASLFLYHLWSDKDIQNLLKKQGMNKSAFVNDITTAVHKAAYAVN